MTKEELLKKVEESYDRNIDVIGDQEKLMGRMGMLQAGIQTGNMDNLLDITVITVLTASK